MENYEKDHYWEFTLRDNPLTKDNTDDCIAEVKSGPKTLRKEDMAKEIKRTGSELKLQTILSVVSQDSEIILEALLDGNSVITDLFQITPRIIGPFDNVEAQFDPAIHHLTFDIVPTKMVREALKKVKVINNGAKGEVSRIGFVADAITRLAGGSITPGKYIRIEGERIRIAGDDALIGVFFISEDGSNTVKAEAAYIQNDPKCVVALVPQLADGKYTLRIVTQYSQGNFLLKEPRTIEYKKLLQVGAGGSGEDDRPVIE